MKVHVETPDTSGWRERNREQKEKVGLRQVSLPVLQSATLLISTDEITTAVPLLTQPRLPSNLVWGRRPLSGPHRLHLLHLILGFKLFRCVLSMFNLKG